MEYCKYGDLYKYIRNGHRLREDELRDITSCCLQGLETLHKHKIMHRVDK